MKVFREQGEGLLLEMEKIIIDVERAPEPQKIIVKILKEFSTFFDNSSKLSPPH